MLLEHGVKLNEANVFGDTPLTKALKDKLYIYTEVIEILLKHGADPNYEAPRRPGVPRKGHTKPLFAAIESGESALFSLYCLCLHVSNDNFSLCFLQYIVLKPFVYGENPLNN